MRIGDGAGRLSRRESQIKRSAFGIGEERAGLIIPECLYLLFVNTLIKRAQRRVRLAILAASGSACHCTDQALRSVINGAFAVNHAD